MKEEFPPCSFIVSRRWSSSEAHACATAFPGTVQLKPVQGKRSAGVEAGAVKQSPVQRGDCFGRKGTRLYHFFLPRRSTHDNPFNSVKP